MKTGSVICLCCALVMLSSCALQDNSQRSGADNNVMTVEESEVKVNEISKLYDGWEELQGKHIGDHIIMPQKITPVDLKTVYTFRVKENTNKSDIEQRAKTLFKSFFGERYDESLVEQDGDEWCYNVVLPPADGEDPVAASPDYGAYAGYPLSIMKTDTSFNDPAKMTVAVYDPKSDRDTELELIGGKCTVGEICGTVQKFIDREFVGYEGLKVEPTAVFLFNDSDNGKLCKRAYVNCGMVKDGVNCLDWFTQYNTQNVTADGTEDTYYSPYYIRFILDGKDDIIYCNSSGYPVKTYDETKYDELISLKTAVGLIDKNMAEELVFRFEKVSLIYCTKTTTKSTKAGDSQIEFRDFRPTWVFEWNTKFGAFSSASIKVDAISGEITLDANTLTMNELQKEKANK